MVGQGLVRVTLEMLRRLEKEVVVIEDVAFTPKRTLLPLSSLGGKHMKPHDQSSQAKGPRFLIDQDMDHLKTALQRLL